MHGIVRFLARPEAHNFEIKRLEISSAAGMKKGSVISG
jgi:hypothetical protein